MESVTFQPRVLLCSYDMICCLFFTISHKSLLTCATNRLERRVIKVLTTFLSNSQPFLCVAVCPLCIVILHSQLSSCYILYLKLLYLTFHASGDLFFRYLFFFLFILLFNLLVYSNLFVFIDLCVAHEARFGCTNTTVAEYLLAVLLGVWLLLD